MNVCLVREFPRVKSLGLMSESELWDYLENCGEALPREVAELAPLSPSHQKVLLAFSHYMTPVMRDRLLLRLSAHPDFYAPLFYELADRAGGDSRRRAAETARENRCADAYYMLESIS